MGAKYRSEMGADEPDGFAALPIRYMVVVGVIPVAVAFGDPSHWLGVLRKAAAAAVAEMPAWDGFADMRAYDWNIRWVKGTLEYTMPERGALLLHVAVIAPVLATTVMESPRGLPTEVAVGVWMQVIGVPQSADEEFVRPPVVGSTNWLQMAALTDTPLKEAAVVDLTSESRAVIGVPVEVLRPSRSVGL